MHPGALAARRAYAEARIERAAASLAERAGIELDEERAKARDASVSDLYRLEYVAGLLERLAGESPLRSDSGPGLTPLAQPSPGVLAGNISEVRAALSEIEDGELLALLLAQETAGDARKGVISAIEARSEKLAAQTEE